MKTITKVLLTGLTALALTACGSSGGGDSAQDKAIDKISNYAQNGGAAPTLQDYLDAGVTGITNVDEINAYVSGLTKEDVDTKEEIQAIAAKLGVSLSPVAKIYVTRASDTTDPAGYFKEGQLIRFSGEQSIDPDGTIVSYQWSEGSKMLASISVFDTSTLSVGKHTITLTVTDNSGNSTSTDAVVRVSEVPVAAPEPEAEAQTQEECLATANYGTIVLGGRTWLDRNLGASQVADSLTDTLAHGNLYQWGRAAEGHELRSSDTTTGVHGGGGGNHATTLEPNTGADWDGLFITEGSNGDSLDWVKNNVDLDGSQRVTLWGTPSSASNLNQVCPCGYVVPSAAELLAADPSELKLTYNGYRDTSGNLYGENSYGEYWTRDGNAGTASFSEYNIGTLTGPHQGHRMYGFGVRCIKP